MTRQQSRYCLRFVGFLVLASILAGATGCVRPPRMQDTPPPETTRGQVWEATWNYGTIDEYVRTGDPVTIGQGVLLYPTDFVFDIYYRVPKGILYDLPRAAWKTTFGDGEETGPALGRYTVVASPVLLPANYLREYFSGLGSHVVRNPIEVVSHTAVAWWRFVACPFM